MAEPLFETSQIWASNSTFLAPMSCSHGGEYSLIPCRYSSSERSFQEGALESHSYVGAKRDFQRKTYKLNYQPHFLEV